MNTPVRSAVFIFFTLLSISGLAEEWDHTLSFKIDAKGEDKSMSVWGMGTIGGPGIMQSGLRNMGSNQIDVVLMPFPVKDPLNSKGELSLEAKTQMDEDLKAAKLAGDKPLVISPDTAAGIHDYYLEQPNKMNTERWVDLLVAVREYIDRPVAWVMPFNEPDWADWKQGSVDDLEEIMGELKKSPAFKTSKMAGPSVLNVDWAMEWYRGIKSKTEIGTMHTLNGSFESYVDFIEYIEQRGDMPFNPEVHNLVEVIVGAEYGLAGGIWWLTCDEKRGAFVKACQGVRLAYEEDRERWSAAAVYRAPSGKVQAFLGSNERTGQDTTYRFVCEDREVYFNGEGPQKEYVVTIKKDSEQMIEITWDREASWNFDVQEAQKEAVINRLPILLLYTAPTWNDDSQKLNEQLVKQDAFMTYANKNLVLLVVNFSDKAKGVQWVKRNKQLVELCPVEPLPGMHLLTPEGVKLGTIPFESEWDVQDYIERFDSLQKEGSDQ
ncbi:MAG: hypothetical protein JXR40_05685 [Pontiellaceae bacterium]|nr:hypothetical protein [Pontiellaceae bacterium]